MGATETLTIEAWRGYQRDTFPAGSWMHKGGVFNTVAEAERIDLVTRQQYRNFGSCIARKASYAALYA